MPEPSVMPPSDSSPELIEKADLLDGAAADGVGKEPQGVDQGQGHEEEEEVEEEEEEVEEYEEEEEEEEEDGAKSEVKVEDEEEEEGEGNGGGNEEEVVAVVEEVAGEAGGADFSNKDDDDSSKKHEGHCKGPKSVSSDPERPYINSTNSPVKDVRGGNLSNSLPSKPHNEKTSEISDGDTSQCSLLRRPRSLSPSTVHESGNKKAAIICDFFAKGWCIKGNSCRFLHKKDGVVFTCHVAKEDRATIGDSIDLKGSPEKVVKSSASASTELIGLPNIENSSKPDLLLQRALVRAYGQETHGLSEIRDLDNLHASYLALDELRQKTMFGEENRTADELKHNLNSIDDRHSACGKFRPRQYSNEERMYQGMPSAASLSDTSVLRESSYTKRTSENDSSNIYSFERRSDNPAIGYQQSHFPLHDSYNSCLTGSVNSIFENSLHSIWDSPSIESRHSFTQAGTRFTHGSSPLSAENKDIHRTFDYGRGLSGVTSEQQNIARDTPNFSGQKSELQENTWECSVPFRSSFCSALAIKLSSGSQYDQLVDCKDLPKGTITSASPKSIENNMSNQHIVGDPMLGGDLIPGYNAKKSVNSFPPAYEGMLGIEKSLHVYCGYTTAVVPPGSSIDDEGINYAAKEEKTDVPHLTDAAHVSEADFGGNMREVDKVKDTKESKEMKTFRSALVEFFKELLKPYWKEGHLSRDAHKMIVKKAVEKVTSALQPHQVPSDIDSISQYLSTSRPKLVKLVEGYVEKYNIV